MTGMAAWGLTHDDELSSWHSCANSHRLMMRLALRLPCEAIMRRMYLLVLCFLALGLDRDAAAETAATCPNSPLAAEASSLEKEQLDELLSQQATACVKGGKPALAVALLTEVIRHAPTDAAAYLNRGSAQAAAGEVTLALGDYTTALHLNPNLVEAWYDRGTTYLHLRRYESAIADFTEALSLKPDFALAYCNRGLANLQLGRYDDALADYSVAIDKDAAISRCYFNRGNLYLILGEYQKAIDDFTEVLASEKDAIALSRRGQAYEALNQRSQALDDYNAALSLNHNLESAEEGQARIMARNQESEQKK